jgi:dihydrofolate reductase
MGKLLWHTLMSLDGFIAGPNDDMSWAFGMDAGSGETVETVLSSTGALLVGRRTQDVEDRMQPGFYGGAFRVRSSCCDTIRRRTLLWSRASPGASSTSASRRR